MYVVFSECGAQQLSARVLSPCTSLHSAEALLDELCIDGFYDSNGSIIVGACKFVASSPGSQVTRSKVKHQIIVGKVETRQAFCITPFVLL